MIVRFLFPYFNEDDSKDMLKNQTIKSLFILVSFFSSILFMGCERVDAPFSGTATGGVIITGGPLIVDETGTNDSFTVALDSQPDSTVKICLNSSDTGEAVISVTGDVLGPDTDCSNARIEFNNTDWNIQKTVTVTGVDDAYSDGTSSFMIILQNTISAGSNYVGVKPPNVSGTTIDNEGAAGINMSPASGLVVEETGLSTGISVSLNTQPENNVKICLQSSNPAEAAVVIGGDVQGPDGDCSTASIQFGFTDWFYTKTIVVRGVGDGINDGDIAFNIYTTNVSTDPVYSLINPVNPAGTNYNSGLAYTWSPPVGTGFTTIDGQGGTTDVFGVDQPNSSVSIGIGFNFIYAGTSYSNINITTEGTAILGTPSLSSTNQDLYTPATPQILLAPWWDDQELNYTSFPNGKIQYLTTGSSPNRVFTIEWNKVNISGSTGTFFTYQVKLYETTNVIEFIYDTANLGAIDSSASIGIKGNPYGSVFFIDGLTGSSINPGNFNLTVADFPAGRVITFTP